MSLKAFSRVYSWTSGIARTSGQTRLQSRFSTRRGGGPLVVSEEVVDAVRRKKPVVALETTIYTHGFPYPDNIALSSSLESLVREHGGVPATIGILKGVAKVGMNASEIIELLEKTGDSHTVKVSRRDLGFVCGNQRYYGGTTIAGTLVLAHLAGIKVFATGGLGGVHRDEPGVTSMDISADLTELGRTPMALISSGCKSFLDIPRTLEYLETQGVGVGTFADGRQGSIMFPAFWTRESDFTSPKVIKDEAEAAAILHAQLQLSLQSGLLFANPIPEEDSLPKDMIDHITDQAIKEAAAKGVKGSANTPYILSRIKDLTNGGTVKANRSLVESNIIRGTKVAVELARLESNSLVQSGATFPQAFQSSDFTPSPSPVDVLVAGSLAIDLSCDYTPLKQNRRQTAPALQTSNPASITQSLGGVGQNIATACHYMGTQTILCTLVGDDQAGISAVRMLENKGMDTSGVGPAPSGARTAQYVAVNGVKKDLVIAMADMKILETCGTELDSRWSQYLLKHQPKWLVLDANWSPETLGKWFKTAKQADVRIAYEPVSIEKSTRLWETSPNTSIRGTADETRFENLVDLATPNEMELEEMAKSLCTIPNLPQLQDNGLDELVKRWIATHTRAVEAKTISNALWLTTRIPCVLTKLGSKGVLQTEVLQSNDPRLRDPAVQQTTIKLPHIAFDNKQLPARAVYVRHHPAEQIDEDQILSVNGAGDTFLGVLVALLSRGVAIYPEQALETAQKASMLTLKSRESVSPDIRHLIA